MTDFYIILERERKDMSEKMIEMSGCSKIDIEFARMFWKSFTLQPPIESKLYSPDIKQRRKTADACGELLYILLFYILVLKWWEMLFSSENMSNSILWMPHFSANRHFMFSQTIIYLIVWNF